MGYYMYLARTPEGEEEAYEGAVSSFDSAVQFRDQLDLPVDHPGYEAAQAAVARYYDAMAAVRTTNFYLTTWAMSECRTIMDHFGMLTAVPPPHHPRPEEFEGSPGKGTAARPDDPALAQRFLAAVEERLSWAPLRPAGIAAHKLGGDEGWTVTPDEIRAALSAYEANRGTDPAFLAELIETADWWPEWIAYLKHAAAHGGFRTYGPPVA